MAITLVSQAMVPGVTEIPFVRAALSPDNLILVHERLVWRLMDWVAEMGLEQLSVDASAGSAAPRTKLVCIMRFGERTKLNLRK